MHLIFHINPTSLGGPSQSRSRVFPEIICGHVCPVEELRYGHGQTPRVLYLLHLMLELGLNNTILPLQLHLQLLHFILPRLQYHILNTIYVVHIGKSIPGKNQHQ